MWGLPQRQGSIHWSTFDVSRQLAERGEACLVHRLPAHGRGGSQDEVKLAPPYARSLAHACGGSQDEEKNLLLPPFTPRPYYLGYRDYIILFGIYMSFSTPSIYLYKATIKNTFCIYTRPQIVIETKVTTPSFPVYGSILKSLQPRQTVSGQINFVLLVCTSNQYTHFLKKLCLPRH